MADKKDTALARGREAPGRQSDVHRRVLEVSVPLPAKTETKPRTVRIDEPAKSAKSAA